MNELNLLKDLPNNAIVRSVIQTITDKQEALTYINHEMAKLQNWEQAMEQQHGYGSKEHASVLAVYREGVRILSRGLDSIGEHRVYDIKTDYEAKIVDTKDAEAKYNSIDWDKAEATLPAEARLFSSTGKETKNLMMNAFKRKAEPELALDIRSER